MVHTPERAPIHFDIHDPQADPAPFLPPKSTGMRFRSGYAFLSAAIFLALAAVLARFNSSLYAKAFLLVASIVLVKQIDPSRVDIGVHRLIAILASWSAGFVRAIFCWIGAFFCRARRIAGDDTAALPFLCGVFPSKRHGLVSRDDFEA